MISPFVVLLAAIGIEVGATTALPRTRGFHDLFWSVLVLGGYALSIWLLAIVVKQMSVSVAYAVWSGLGTAAIAGVSVFAFGERLDLVKVTALVLIIVGVVVLNLHTVSPAHGQSGRPSGEPLTSRQGDRAVQVSAQVSAVPAAASRSARVPAGSAHAA
jgi:small multidrug resistance pump